MTDPVFFLAGRFFTSSRMRIAWLASHPLSVAGLASDAAVSRSTVQNYFSILEDTLPGFWMHLWKRKSGTRQVAHPKFYFFDSSVCRALTDRLPYPATDEERGPLLETWLLHGGGIGRDIHGYAAMP